MGEVNFSNNAANAAADAANAESLERKTGVSAEEAAQVPGMAVARQADPILGDDMPSFAQIILPTVNISQNIGFIKDTHEPGSIVFGMNTSIWTPPKFDAKTGNTIRAATDPVEITVLGFRPIRYVEKTVGGARGIICNTEQQVTANGGTLDYAEWQLKQLKGMKLFQPLATAMVVVARPAHLMPIEPRTEEDEAVFVYTVDGKRVALGLWNMKGTAYTAAAKRVFFTARKTGCLKEGGYPSWSFSMTAIEQTFGTNKAWVPNCVPKDRNTPAFLAWVKELLAPATAAAQTAEEAQEAGE